MDPLTFLNQHQFLAFFTSASAGAAATIIAGRNMQKTHWAAGVKELKAEVKGLRPTFDAADALSTACVADPWIVLGTRRSEACAVLSTLQQLAASYPAPSVWHAALSPAQWTTVHQFLRHAAPLILVLRKTGLAVTGEHRPYNGDKAAMGRAILRAFRLRLGCRS